MTNPTLTGTNINRFRARIVILAMRSHIESNGQMSLTRTATPANLRALATEYTGVSYPRSRKGTERAYSDMLEKFPPLPL